MGKFYRLLSVSIIQFLVSSSVWADVHSAVQSENVSITYEGTLQAFRNGTSPSLDDLLGRWMNVGGVANPESAYAGKNGNFYSPDGKVKRHGKKGYFKYFSIFESAEDVFGNVLIRGRDTLVGYETGKVYNQYEYLGTLTKNGALFEFSPEGYCKQELHCRVDKGSSFLICSYRITKNSPNCVDDKDLEHSYFTIFRRL